MKSMHRRIWRAAGSVIVIALMLAGGTAYFLIQDALTDDLDRSLLDQAKALAGQVERQELRGASPADQGRGFLIRTPQGLVLARGGEPDLVQFSQPPGDVPMRMMTTNNDDEVRAVRVMLLAAKASAQAAPDLVEITVSQDLDHLHQTLAGIGVALLVACVGVSAVVALILGRVIQSAMQPLTTLSALISQIQPGDQTIPISPAAVPRELSPIVEQLSALLTRLTTALAHERTFSAAAAHELRTPLAGLRTTLDVALARPRDAESLRASATGCHSIVLHLQQVVAGLLTLARADAQRLAPAIQTVELVAVIADVWSGIARQDAAKKPPVSWSLPVQAVVAGDPHLIALVVRTLLDNAVAHGSDESAIRVTLTPAASPEGHSSLKAPSRWWLIIANPGCQLPPGDVAKVFDRFWRGDQARSGDSGHTGLGLSLCQAAAQAGGAQVAVTVKDGWFTATVQFPTSVATHDVEPKAEAST